MDQAKKVKAENNINSWIILGYIKLLMVDRSY